MKFSGRTINLPLALISSSSLLVCILSGIPLCFHYFYSQPLMSVLTIELYVPFGKFLRNLHYLSAQIALLSMFFHLLDSLIKRLYELKTPLSWFSLVLSFFVLLFLTFSGYLLRGDEVGELAGAIGENLLLYSFPLFGEILNKIFLAPSKVGLIKIYHWHLILSFLLTLGIFIWHVKIKILLKWDNLIYFLWLPLMALLIKFPLVPFNSLQPRGPWFFVGAQEMLKYFEPPFVFLYLILPMFILLSYVYLPRYAFWLNMGGFLYLLIYILASLIFFLK
ncbi:MAG: cytochrome b N-terminal domain-containing protein [Caldimicrobium sp.]|nr:cytochrome b N-terminal domain-containing protein [Caldimicrobium sp.]MCX7873338.1 cytochrome b N-terminal domain-containing protein [Caldimicrobium sp.]MDW8093424.1 cytochrome b N-terminal domain-containing protein [Caldimicrobium sp.]